MTGDVPRDSLDVQAAHVSLHELVKSGDAEMVWPVYDAVFSDWPNFEAWREGVWAPHSAREGFRLACANRDDVLIGFAYGYTGQPGQWWTDNARDVLAPDVAAQWLGGHFELVSIGVVSQARHIGVGRALMRCVTEDLPQDRWLLMTTADVSDPARRLYAAEGWHVIGPGIGDAQVIVGKRKR